MRRSREVWHRNKGIPGSDGVPLLSGLYHSTQVAQRHTHEQHDHEHHPRAELQPVGAGSRDLGKVFMTVTGRKPKAITEPGTTSVSVADPGGRIKQGVRSADGI